MIVFIDIGFLLSKGFELLLLDAQTAFNELI
jgi:hypothetical protein